MPGTAVRVGGLAQQTGVEDLVPERYGTAVVSQEKDRRAILVYERLEHLLGARCGIDEDQVAIALAYPARLFNLVYRHDRLELEAGPARGQFAQFGVYALGLFAHLRFVVQPAPRPPARLFAAAEELVRQHRLHDEIVGGRGQRGRRRSRPGALTDTQVPAAVAPIPAIIWRRDSVTFVKPAEQQAPPWPVLSPETPEVLLMATSLVNESTN